MGGVEGRLLSGRGVCGWLLGQKSLLEMEVAKADNIDGLC